METCKCECKCKGGQRAEFTPETLPPSVEVAAKPDITIAQKPKAKKRRLLNKIPYAKKENANPFDQVSPKKQRLWHETDNQSKECEKSLSPEEFLTDLNIHFDFYPSPRNSEEWLKEMISSWVKCDQYNSRGMLPIHEAVLSQNMLKLKMQCLSLQYKTKTIDWTTDDGDTALHLSLIFKNSDAMVLYLLAKGANVSETNSMGNNSLHLSVLYSHSRIVFQKLLRKASYHNLQAYNNDGKTVLHLIVHERRFDFLQIFMENLHLLVNLSPMYENIQGEHEFLRKLQHCLNCNDVQPVLKETCEQKQRIIDMTDLKNGRTALLESVCNQYDEMASYLTIHRADVTMNDLSGCAPIYIIRNTVLSEYNCHIKRLIQLLKL